MTITAAVPNDPIASLIQTIHDKFISGLSPEKTQWLGKRPDRALVLATEGAVFATDKPGVYQVYSSGGPPTKYTVDLNERTCTCPDFTQSGFVCKHRIAAYYHQKAAAEQVKQPESASVKVFNGAEHPAIVLKYLSQPVKQEGDYIVYAWLEMGGNEEILVEVLDSMSDISTAYVRALPTIDEDGNVEAQFPFPSPFGAGANDGIAFYSTGYVSKSDLKNVRVCQKGYDQGV